MIWLYLLLLGLTLYLVVQNSVSRVTRTPWWLLWLVLMLPTLVIMVWVVLNGTQARSVPPGLLVTSFIISSVLYFILVQRNRLPAPQPGEKGEKAQDAKPDPLPLVRPLNKTEESQLQNCFPWSVFYLQQVEYRPQAVICRGQLRSQPEEAYRTIRQNIESHFGERFLVLFQIGASNKPFFALVPNVQAQIGQPTQPLTRPFLALGLLLVTLLTTLWAGVQLAQPGVAEPMIWNHPGRLLVGLPYALSLMGILGLHELGHYLTARFYRIRVTLPYFIPVPFALGTFGAFIQMRSPIPNRKTLFDVGLSGPLAGLVPTVPLLIWGLLHSTLVPLPEQVNPFNFSAFNPSLSILLALISKAIFGPELTANMGINLHPVAIAGCLGLVVTALNLMPVGQLDGGHIVHAMFGQRTGAAIGQLSRLLVLVLAWIQPWLLFWAIILFFIPAVDEPALNDVTELNNLRDLLGLLALGLLLLIILPAPDALTQFLFPANPMP